MNKMYGGFQSEPSHVENDEGSHKKPLFWKFLQAKVKKRTQLNQNKWSLSVWDKQSKGANTPTRAKKRIL